ncbi:ABC1 family protein [Ceratobasidium sp. AG-Ba]|nr:ABC1 family protein [Ceratobasidium sp. AG-Ba]
MSPSRAYDALTILWTTADVLRRATLITIDRKIPAAAYIQVSKTRPRETKPAQTSALTLNEATPKTVTQLVDRTTQREGVFKEPFDIPPDTWSYVHSAAPNHSTASGTRPALSTPQDAASVLSQSLENSSISEGLQAPSNGSQATIEDFDYQADAEPPVKLTPSRVPSSRLGRLFHYGSLGASLAAGTATEYVRRAATGSNGSSGSPMMSEANVARLVDKLSRMRGAALKLGQFLSIQDAHVLPEQIERVLRQVQNNAHYMPNAQLESVLVAELGSDWRSKFADFDPIPIASASIGQVHKVTVSPSIISPSPSEPIPIALKVQFPNIAESISSDLANISTLLKASALLPRGLYLDRTLKVMRGELADECDYEREATALERFADFLGRKQERFKIPRVIREVTTKRVLAMEWMEGISVAKGAKWPKRIRDQIARDILTLCLRELFEFRFMQTDPNWSNFLYNPKTDQLELIDFGASREYSKGFMDNWYLLLSAAVQENREKCIQYSLELGYLTGQENEEMLAAHVRSLTLLGIPFRSSTTQPFSFASQTITDEIRALIPVMLRHRLTPPPQETYSLNRKLSGAFLLCGRLGADVDCRAIWEEVVGAYRLG